MFGDLHTSRAMVESSGDLAAVADGCRHHGSHRVPTLGSIAKTRYETFPFLHSRR